MSRLLSVVKEARACGMKRCLCCRDTEGSCGVVRWWSRRVTQSQHRVLEALKEVRPIIAIAKEIIA